MTVRTHIVPFSTTLALSPSPASFLFPRPPPLLLFFISLASLAHPAFRVGLQRKTAGVVVQDLLGTKRKPQPLCTRMAKPLSVASSDCPGTSKSTSNSSQAPAPPAHRPQYRRHRNFKHSVPRPTPSSGILILLASLASSASVANGTPAPLSFLCPSVGTQDNTDAPPIRRACSSSPPTSTSNAILSKATGLPSVVAARHVPDRFSQGPDGVWRRVGSYTLYGSTVSACVGVSKTTSLLATSNSFFRL